MKCNACDKKSGLLYSTMCRHLFHKECIKKIIQCPVCNKIVMNYPSKNYFPSRIEDVVGEMHFPTVVHPTSDRYPVDLFLLANNNGVMAKNSIKVEKGEIVDFYSDTSADYIRNITLIGEDGKSVPLDQTSWLKVCSPYMSFNLSAPDAGTLSYEAIWFANILRNEIRDSCDMFSGDYLYRNGIFRKV